jgi:O-antigen/teichoic acid export membrane protein
MVTDAVRYRLGTHLRIPLYREGYALILGSAITSVIGLGYWILAAHSYRPEIVGLNSAAISAMMFLAGLAQLNLVSALIRFVPTAGRMTRTLIACSYLVAFLPAALASSIFLLGVRIWAPNLSFLTSSSWFAVWFAAAALGWCAYLLQDAALTGLRRALWVPVDGTVFSGAKIILLLVFAALFPRYGIFASWTAAIVVALIPINFLIFFRFVPARVRESSAEVTAVSVPRIARYASVDYLGSLAFLASTTLVPLIVTQKAGAAANAYFSLSWVMVVPLYFISTNLGSSLIVTAAADEEHLATYAYRTFVQALRLSLPLVAVMAVGAPYFLRLFGPVYAHEGANALRLLALSAIPNVVNTLFVCTCRVRRRMWGVVAVLGSQCVLVLGLSWWLLDVYGITGVGLAWLIAQCVVAAVVLMRSVPALVSEQARRLPLPADAEDPPPARVPSSPAALALLRNAAADLHLLPLLRAGRGQVLERRASADVAGVVHDVLERSGLDSRGWRVHSVVPSLSDTVVTRVGPPGGPPEAAVKIAHSRRGVHSLRQEGANLKALKADPRLAGWSAALPHVYYEGELPDRWFLVEGIVPGVEARRLVSRPATRWTVLTTASAAIDFLRRSTASSPAPFDPEALARCVAMPLAALRARTVRGPRDTWRLDALDRLEDLLHRTLPDKPVSRSWVHGDFVPSNIFVTPDGTRLTGIVDWDLARSDGIPGLDVMQLLLATRMLVRRRELGQVVCELLREPRLDEHERIVLDRALSVDGEEQIGLTSLVLLAWLDHVSGVLSKSDRYAQSWAWLRLNVDGVLHNVCRP